MTITQSQEELKPCPFCGCGGPCPTFSAPDGYIWCENCDATGPARDTKAEAIAAWNRRAPLLRHAEGVGWRPIETAPKDAFILVFDEDEGDDVIAMVSWQGGYWYGVDDLGLTFTTENPSRKPTHWMPLPNPPQEGRGQ